MRDSFLPYGLHDIDEEDISEVVNTLKSDWITTGPKIEEFEKKFCEYVGCDFAVAVNSGTAALDIAVGSLELEKGSEIITTPFTFVATANSIVYNNCKPVFADIREDTYNIDPEQVREKITEKTKAIISVDYAGQPCEYNELREIAKENDLFLIADAAQSLGAEYHDKKTGSLADITTFSFHPVKHITTGEGGMVTTNDQMLYNKMKMLRNHGIDKDAKDRFGPDSSWAYDMKMLGRNYRLTDFQAALGISQLKKIDDFVKKRQSVADEYNRSLNNLAITLPYVKDNVKHSWHLYTLLLNSTDRNRFFNRMRSRNIGVNVHHIPIYRHTYYRKNFKFDRSDFPITEDVFSRTITLPIFPKMVTSDVQDVVSAVQDSLKSLS